MDELRITVDARQPGESLRDWLARVDPDLLAAAEEVDVTLLDAALALSPLERLRACTRATRGLASFRRVST